VNTADVWASTGCVLWVIRNGHADYELCDDEAEAANMAAFYECGGSDNVYDVLGVQFRDGRTVIAATWPAMADAVRAQRAADQERRDNPPPPLPTKKIRDPFTAELIDADTDAPAWVGAPL